MSLLDQVVALADDALVLGHRLSEWCGKAPFLEEDLALANTALDLLGRARALYGYAESLAGGTRTNTPTCAMPPNSAISRSTNCPATISP